MQDPDSGPAAVKPQPAIPVNFREQLGSVEAMSAYDAYCREHSRRLRQLQQEAAGVMAPSGDWYREARR